MIGTPQARALLGRVAVVAVAAGCALFVIAAFAPGYMSYDSFMQLGQARSGVYSDWHPPLMSWIWRQFDRYVPGPLGMLVFHNVMLWSALALVLWRRYESAWAAVLLPIVGLWPPILGLAGTIWKDVSMGTSMLLAFALLLDASVSRRRISLWLSLVPFCYALSARHDAIFAGIPLAFWWGRLWAESRYREKARRWSLVAGAALSGACWIGVSLTSRYLTEGRSNFVSQQVFLHDLAGLSKARHHNLLPEWWQARAPASSLELLEQQYLSTDAISSLRDLPGATNSAELRDLAVTWLTAIWSDPRTYFRNRLSMFRHQFSIATDQVYYPFHEGIEPLEPRIEVHPSNLNPWVMRFLSRARESLVYRPWLYCLLALFFVVAYKHLSPGRRAPTIVLGLSSLAYALPHFVLSPVPDFRLLWWTVVAAAILPLLAIDRDVVDRLLQRRREARPAS